MSTSMRSCVKRPNGFPRSSRPTRRFSASVSAPRSWPAPSAGASIPIPRGLCEVGYQPLDPANEDCPLFPSPIHVYHWHREGFDLPPGAELLARGVIFENQAFSHGERAFGFSFTRR